jgi:uncharacterized protein (DUF111 family)
LPQPVKQNSLAIFDQLAAKEITGIDGNVRIIPEFEVCKNIAMEQGVPLRTVYAAVVRSA